MHFSNVILQNRRENEKIKLKKKTLLLYLSVYLLRNTDLQNAKIKQTINLPVKPPSIDCFTSNIQNLKQQF